MIIRKLIVFSVLLPAFLVMEAWAQESTAFQTQNRNFPDTSEIRILRELAMSSYSTNPELSLNYSNRMLQLAIESGDLLNQARAFNHIGIVKNIQSRYVESIDAYQKAAKIYLSINYIDGLLSIYNNIGVIYSQVGNHASALEYFHKTFRLAEEEENYEVMVLSKINIANTWYESGDYILAAGIAQEAINAFEGTPKLIFPAYEAFLHSVTGRIYLKQGDILQAEKHILISRQKIAGVKDLYYGSDIDMYYAVLLMEKGQLEKAIEEVNRAIDQKIQIGDKRGLIRCYIISGQIREKQGYPGSAEIVYTKAREMALENEMLASQQEVFQALHQYRSRLGNYKKAYEDLLQSNLIGDSLFRIEKQLLANEYRVRYETDRFRNENELQKLKLEKQTQQQLFIFIIGGFFAGLAVMLILLIIQMRKRSQLLEGYNEQLEVLVDERTKDLKKAKEKAEESEQLKTAFLANISHEIRTPLNSILGFSEILRHEEVNPESRYRYLGIIHDKGGQLLRLIDDLIEISRLEARQFSIFRKEVYPARILEEQFEFFQSLIPKSKKDKLRLVFEEIPGEANRMIHTDPNRLIQVMTNLIGNAGKFTPNGIILYGMKFQNGEAVFHVTDTGPGIPADKLERIFDRFLKLENDKSSFTEGAGLGLAISKGIVEMLGGKIWVESTEGKGTKFQFSLPA